MTPSVSQGVINRRPNDRQHATKERSERTKTEKTALNTTTTTEKSGAGGGVFGLGNQRKKKRKKKGCECNGCNGITETKRTNEHTSDKKVRRRERESRALNKDRSAVVRCGGGGGAGM